VLRGPFDTRFHGTQLQTFPVLLLQDGRIRPVAYQETEHFELTRAFLEAAERFYRFLLTDD
jgi:hypothetical protein